MEKDNTTNEQKIIELLQQINQKVTSINRVVVFWTFAIIILYAIAAFIGITNLAIY